MDEGEVELGTGWERGGAFGVQAARKQREKREKLCVCVRSGEKIGDLQAESVACISTGKIFGGTANCGCGLGRRVVAKRKAWQSESISAIAVVRLSRARHKPAICALVMVQRTWPAAYRACAPLHSKVLSAMC